IEIPFLFGTDDILQDFPLTIKIKIYSKSYLQNSLLIQPSLRHFLIFTVYYKSNEWAGIYGLKEMDEEKWLTKKP
uniref:Uncharacterized protein n=1 Tax=Laticauda laticaudata TaxID=8630 RepID=A0A8C5WUB8_LATLA